MAVYAEHRQESPEQDQVIHYMERLPVGLNGLSIASLVLAILGLAAPFIVTVTGQADDIHPPSFVWLVMSPSMICQVVAVILGLYGIKQVDRWRQDGKVAAYAGVVLGFIGLIFVMVCWILALAHKTSSIWG